MIENFTIINENTILTATGNFVNDECTSTLEVKVDIKKQLLKVIASVKIFVPQDETNETFEFKSFGIMLDFEKMQNGRNTHFITKLIFDEFLKSVKPPLSFPTSSKSYLLKMKFPKFLYPVLQKFRCEIIYKVRIAKEPKCL